MTQPSHNSPLNPLPPVVWLLTLPIVAVEIVLSAGDRGFAGGAAGIGWRSAAIEDYAFYDVLFDRMIATGEVLPGDLMRLVSYLFVNYSFTQALFAVVLLLALGKMVGEVFKPVAVVAVFFVSGIVGAMAYGLLLDEARPLTSAYPAVYGLIGAFTYLLSVNLAARGDSRFGAFSLIGFLMGIQLLFSLLFNSTNDWVADLAGFFTGFGLSFVISPGGWRRVLSRMRQR
ncbi:rhomboid family intramembrane serine protease [Actibacterium sp. XHP0104]|uniref:rhomboid family intramembrane serine protease n=1 Tax=Actibacterium sp. XHP0104 TaxID=2984335 RepID=UPI0021E7CD64|nr:rhomboid family intramembrane serine protease [Actibacterium sp. XHP0104]MCV2882668.1 rhomboid family intramembrane serine protease [Actibacterium sp. XHP0104]